MRVRIQYRFKTVRIHILNTIRLSSSAYLVYPSNITNIKFILFIWHKIKNSYIHIHYKRTLS